MSKIEFFYSFCQIPFQTEQTGLKEKNYSSKKHDTKKAVFSMKDGKVEVSVRMVDVTRKSLETGKLIFSKGVYFCYFNSEKELEKVKKEFFFAYIEDLKKQKSLLEEEIEKLENKKKRIF